MTGRRGWFSRVPIQLEEVLQEHVQLLVSPCDHTFFGLLGKITIVKDKKTSNWVDYEIGTSKVSDPVFGTVNHMSTTSIHGNSTG
jgi:hypothetical protein